MVCSSTEARNTGLVAIALIIRSRDGPRFVFHYPAHPTAAPTTKTSLWGTDLDDTKITAAEDTDSEDEESELEERNSSFIYSDLGSDEHTNTPDGRHVVPWETLLEFPTTDLESILTPSRSYNKKRFELTLDPLYFISYPIHIRDDGLWKKKKPKKNKKAKKQDPTTDTPNGDTKECVDSKPSTNDDNKSEEGDDHGGMTMFNIVFILKLSKQDAPERAEEMYEHIIKKFNKALHLAQASSNYVWKESEMILTMKEKAREERRPMSWLWSHILLKSTLASAMRDIFDAIQNSKIATVSLTSTPPLDLSLQIPVPSFLMSLPAYNERGMPGLQVTSANYLVDDDGNEYPTHVNKHFALLLLDQESKVVAELEADGTDLSQPLINCIQVCKPTISFLQVSREKSLELGSLLTLAQHLIYWRRAIAIPPLHGRNTYIVSPNCDLRKLPGASVAWKKAFPLSPPLQSFLSALSRSPREYKSFAPSKNHRPMYLEMLAWLLRGGWVTQTFFFSWILVWPEIIYEVQYQLKAEAIEKAKALAAQPKNSTASDSTAEGSTSSPDANYSSSPSQLLTTEEAAENARLSRLAEKTAKLALQDASDFAKMVAPVATEDFQENYADHLKHIAPYIIKDPHRVSHEESLYIAAIGKRIKDTKAKECWLRFAKYFNGREPLESIALRENMKRKETWNTLLAYQQHLLACQHW